MESDRHFKMRRSILRYHLHRQICLVCHCHSTIQVLQWSLNRYHINLISWASPLLQCVIRLMWVYYFDSCWSCCIDRPNPYLLRVMTRQMNNCKQPLPWARRLQQVKLQLGQATVVQMKLFHGMLCDLYLEISGVHGKAVYTELRNGGCPLEHPPSLLQLLSGELFPFPLFW